jgi:SEC-C motif
MTAPTSTRPGRNQRCHCGSDRKYKNCCLENDSQTSDRDVGAFLAGGIIGSWLCVVYFCGLLGFVLNSGMFLGIYLYVFFTSFVSLGGYATAFWPLVVIVFAFLGRRLNVRQTILAAPVTIFVVSLVGLMILAKLGVPIQYRE